ncbi:MAG: Maf family protein, partial [Clostridia bacterium]
MKREIILASASPRRKELLEKLDLEFSVCPADI